jgi:hypothetical protein
LKKQFPPRWEVPDFPSSANAARCCRYLSVVLAFARTTDVYVSGTLPT